MLSVLPELPNINAYKKEHDLALRNIFKNEIKPNFLIKIYHKVLEILDVDIFKYYQIPTPTIENSIAGNMLNFDNDICKMIIGIHKSNMIFAGDSEKREKENSDEYSKQIANQTIEHIKLREYGSSYFRQKQIIAGDRFIYFPLPYDLFVICMKMNDLLRNNQNIPCFSIFAKTSNMAMSALSLLEDNFLDNAYPLCRGLIELYLTLFAVLENKNALKKYIDFSKIEAEISRHGKDYPEEFYDLYYNIKETKDKNLQIHQYLHFGWVDELKNYHKIVKENPYTISSLIYYLEKTNSDMDFKIFTDYYKICNSYVHANTLTYQCPLSAYFEIITMLSFTLGRSFEDLCGLLKFDGIINGVNILEKSIFDYKVVLLQRDKITPENLNKYYNK